MFENYRKSLINIASEVNNYDYFQSDKTEIKMQ